MAENSHLVLVVDDDHLLSSSIGDTLKQSGYDVITAADGVEGLKTAIDRRPALILLDFQMPNQNGVETLKLLRDDAWGKTADVVFATNVYDIDVINQVLELGVKEYILKSSTSLQEIALLVGKHIPLKAS